MKKRWILPIAVMILCCIAACGNKDTDDRSADDGDQVKVEEVNDISVKEPLKTFTFQTAADVERLSDEDLLYIATHPYKVSDFIGYDTENQLELFDVPLAEWEFEGMPQKELIERCILRTECALEEMDLNERIPDEEFMKYAKEYCEQRIERQEDWNEDTGTGTKVKDPEIIYCGTTDDYVEYSVRYTLVTTFIDNGRSKTYEMPVASRILFDRNWIQVLTEDGSSTIYLGEYTLEKMKAEEDFWIRNESGGILYREFSETESSIVRSGYTYGISFGDYGLYDRAYLRKSTVIYSKQTHETTVWDEYEIKEVDIPGTYKSWGEL